MSAGVFAPRQHQRVHHALCRNWRPARALQLGVKKGNIKAGIVRHERRLADEGQELVGHVVKRRLVAKNSVVNPCTAMASAGTARSGLR